MTTPADREERATILHADLDSFYASVEQRDDVQLRGRPVAVGGGVILAASYEAKRRGVRSPMPEFRARRLCPELIVVAPRFEAYAAASKAVFDVFHDTTPLVEGISIDEAFLDVGGLGRVSGSPPEIARRLRQAVRVACDLPISVGVARTKFLAKVASAVSKPDGLLVVAPERELEFLHPLPVERLWGVGPATAERLQARGVVTVGDVAHLTEPQLVAILGAAAGRHLHRLAHNRDPRPIVTDRRRGSIGSQSAIGRRARSEPELEALLLAIVDRVSRRLRAAGRAGRTISIRLRYDDFATASRSRTLRHATASTATIAEVATAMLRAQMTVVAERGLTLLGLSVGQLVSLGTASDAGEQLELPFRARRHQMLDTAIDELQGRFGTGAVGRASALGRYTGFEVPKLPD